MTSALCRLYSKTHAFPRNSQWGSGDMDDYGLKEFFAERAREQKAMLMIEGCAVLAIVALALVTVAVFA